MSCAQLHFLSSSNLLDIVTHTNLYLQKSYLHYIKESTYKTLKIVEIMRLECHMLLSLHITSWSTTLFDFHVT